MRAKVVSLVVLKKAAREAAANAVGAGVSGCFSSLLS